MTVNLNTIPPELVINIANRLEKNSLLQLTFVAKAFANVVVDVYKKDDIAKNQLFISRINTDVKDEKKKQDLSKIFAKGLTLDQSIIPSLDNMYGLSDHLQKFLVRSSVSVEALEERPAKRRKLNSY